MEFSIEKLESVKCVCHASSPMTHRLLSGLTVGQVSSLEHAFVCPSCEYRYSPKRGYFLVREGMLNTLDGPSCSHGSETYRMFVTVHDGAKRWACPFPVCEKTYPYVGSPTCHA